MNYIHNLASKGRGFVEYSKKAVSQIGKFVGATAEVGKGVIQGLTPHIINISPWYLSRLTNIKFFSLVGFVATALDRVEQLRNHPNDWLKTTSGSVTIAVNILGILDMLNHIPHETEYRVAIDSILLLATLLGSTRALVDGTHRIISSLKVNDSSITNKVSDLVSGSVLMYLGVSAINNSIQLSIRLANGVTILRTLDPVEQRVVLKHRAIHTLNEKRSCNAVILNADMNLPDSETKLEFPPSTFDELIFEKCETRVIDEVKNSTQFCEVLISARSHFGSSINILNINAHACPNYMHLAENYDFLHPSKEGSYEEISCMDKILSLDAQVFLSGCNTATSSLLKDAKPSITERLSDYLPGREINGFAAYYCGILTTSSYSNGHFHHDNHYPEDSNEEITSLSTVVRKKILN